MSLILDFEKYLEKKKRKIGNSSYGFNRGQHELIIQTLKKLRKLKNSYGVRGNDAVLKTGIEKT